MITYLKYEGYGDETWNFDPIKLSRVNLLVGGSGSGKTRFLNVLFNFGETVSRGEPFRKGYWNVKINDDDIVYDWKYKGELFEDSTPYIKSEIIQHIKNGITTELVQRDENKFLYKGDLLPKLQKDRMSVTLLKDEEELTPIYNTFSRILRRRFHEADLKQTTAYEAIPQELFDRLKSKKDIMAIWGYDHPLNSRMFLLKEFFPDIYEKATETYSSIFPTIHGFEINSRKDFLLTTKDVFVPVFSIKEKGVKNSIPISELSSGMQKVLLIITDILTSPPKSIYIIDEYENSLGINAINFLPDFIALEGGDTQFIITTHHPYLINNMPIKNWIVFHRKGSHVQFKFGEELEELYGKSKQRAFIQLINDPFFLLGD